MCIIFLNKQSEKNHFNQSSIIWGDWWLIIIESWETTIQKWYIFFFYISPLWGEWGYWSQHASIDPIPIQIWALHCNATCVENKLKDHSSQVQPVCFKGRQWGVINLTSWCWGSRPSGPACDWQARCPYLACRRCHPQTEAPSGTRASALPLRPAGPGYWSG